MPALPLHMVNDISDDEYVRRYFFTNHRDESGVWSYNVFQLRNLSPPEYYLSVTRCSVSPDPVAHALSNFVPKRLKKLAGYSLLLASDIRSIDIPSLEILLLSDSTDTSGHAGIFTWQDDVLVEGAVENPALLELKIALYNMSIQSYCDFDNDAFPNPQ